MPQVTTQFSVVCVLWAVPCLFTTQPQWGTGPPTGHLPCTWTGEEAGTSARAPLCYFQDSPAARTLSPFTSCRSAPAPHCLQPLTVSGALEWASKKDHGQAVASVPTGRRAVASSEHSQSLRQQPPTPRPFSGVKAVWRPLLAEGSPRPQLCPVYNSLSWGHAGKRWEWRWRRRGGHSCACGPPRHALCQVSGLFPLCCCDAV